MSKREVAELACRILALWFLVANLHALVGMPVSFFAGVWSLVSREGFNEYGISLVIGSLLFAFIAFVVWFLWTRSAWIASKLVPDDATYSRWPHIRVADLQVAAFSTVGLFVLIRGLRYFVHTMGIYFDSVLRQDSR